MNATTTLEHAVARGLVEAARAHPSLVVLTEHLPGDSSMPEGVTVEAIPVADRGVLAMAVGMAIAGRPVVVELAVASRLRAVAEVLAEAGALQGEMMRTGLVLRVPWGREAATLDGPILTMLSGLPGVRVVSASSPGAAAALLREAIEVPGPTVLLEPRALGAGPADDVVSLGACRRVREGAHMVFLATGADVGAAEEAAGRLADEGIDAGVLDLVSLVPLDRAGLGDALRACGRVVLVAPWDEAGWTRSVVGAIFVEAFYYLEAPPAAAEGVPDALVQTARSLFSG